LQNEYGFAITCLAFISGRKGNSAKGGANLVSCGGNGWVRFWNTNSNKLLAEFTAHSQGNYIRRALFRRFFHPCLHLFVRLQWAR
jgi:hypothetical protein